LPASAAPSLGAHDGRGAAARARAIRRQLFLARYPEWNGKVTLIQVGVPTRVEVDEYKNLAGQVNELVGRINGNYGTLECV
jgi:trehalose-6-phosphate synthase